MIVVLHEQRIPAPGREHADRFCGDRPAGEPLHGGAEPVGTAEYQMRAVRLPEHRFDRAAAARYLGVGEARIFGFENTTEPVWQSHPFSLCQAAYRPRAKSGAS